MERISRVTLTHTLGIWARHIGGHIATDYTDVGGYALRANSPGDGKTRYEVVQIVGDDRGHGERDILHATGTREMWELLRAGIETMRQYDALKRNGGK